MTPLYRASPHRRNRHQLASVVLELKRFRMRAPPSRTGVRPSGQLHFLGMEISNAV
jgi:hypothetical protein